MSIIGFGGFRGNKKLDGQSSSGMRNKKNHEDTMTNNLIPVDLSICSKSITNSTKEHDLFTVINLVPVEEKNLLTYKRRKKKNCLSVDNEEAHSISLQVQENRPKRVVSGSCLDTALLLMEDKGEIVSESVKYKNNLNVSKSVMSESDSSLENNSETPSNILSASFNKLGKNKKLELASLDVVESSSMKDAPSRILKTYKKKKKVIDLSSKEKASEDALVRDSSAKQLKQPEECSLCREENLVREKSPLAWENNLLIKESILLGGCNKEDNLLDMLTSSPGRAPIRCIRRKLLVLDINGLLADIVSFVPHGYKPDTEIAKKALFKRPFCDDFLNFCFEKFDVGVWSSRTKRNVDSVVDFLLGDMQQNLLFCWNQSHCTETGFSTIENRNKPLILKELKKLWDKLEPDLPWEKGVYNESNTLLLDDSPYKALRNPPHTAVFPCPYMFKATNDISLGPEGDLRVYLEGLAMAEDVQKYVKQHHFGQRAITNTNPSWRFYRKVICTENHSYHYRPTQRRYR